MKVGAYGAVFSNIKALRELREGRDRVQWVSHTLMFLFSRFGCGAVGATFSNIKAFREGRDSTNSAGSHRFMLSRLFLY